MLQIERKKFILYIIFIIIFILFTNNFYTFQQTLLINQYDGLSYMNIADSSYGFSEQIIPYHHAQRFYIPFIIGFIGNKLNVENYLIFRIFVIFAILIIVIMHTLLTFKSNCSFKTAIISSSIIFLNPYLIRYFLSVPTMVIDIFFIMGIYIFIYGLLKKNYLIFLGALIALISRQTGLFVFIATIYYCYENKMFKSFLSIFLAFILIFFLSNFYAENTSIGGFNFKHLYGLYDSIFIKKEFYELTKWLMLPFYSFITLIIFIFTRRDIITKNINSEKLIFFFIVLSTIGITLLAGPELAGRNIIRQTSIIFPLLVIYLIFFSTTKNSKKNFLIHEKIIILIFYISSLHPVYSKVKILEFVRIF